MSKPRLSYKLWMSGERIKFQVTKMDESIRGSFDITVGEISVLSFLYPELSLRPATGASYGIHLPGTHADRDNEIACIRISSKGERERVYDLMQAALKECFTSSAWACSPRYPRSARSYNRRANGAS